MGRMLGDEVREGVGARYVYHLVGHPGYLCTDSID